MRARSVLAGMLAALLTRAADARPSPVRPEHEVTAQEVVYQVPGMAQVRVRKDVSYKKTPGEDLRLDLYYPPDFQEGARRPAVVFLNGVGDRPGSRLKEWPVYGSWGRLVAASGWIGVTFDARGPFTASGPDIQDLLRFLRSEGARLGIQTDRMAAWVCSGNVLAGLPVLMEDTDPGLRAAVVYYGGSDLSKLRNDLPVLFVRAGHDNPRLNATIDGLWARAAGAGAPWTMVNAPGSHHAFDVLDETDESRRIVRETLDFFREFLSPRVTTGPPPSLARRALAHWFVGEYAEAASAYEEYVRTHPDDPIATMRLGISQAHVKRPAQASANLEKAVALGADQPIDLYNVACGYALLGEREKALAWLERAVAAGFHDRTLLSTDDDLEGVRGLERFQALLAKIP